MFESLSIREIILMIVGGGGFIAGIVALATLIFGRVDKNRERRKTEKDQHSSETAAVRKVELDKDQAAFDRIWKILESERAEIDELNVQNDSLAARLRTTLDELDKAQKDSLNTRKLHIEDLDRLAEERRKTNALETTVAELKEKLRQNVIDSEKMINRSAEEIKILQEKLKKYEY